jgi:ketosteroid isomerase-like protein
LDVTDKPTAVGLARRSVETFVSTDIKGWVALTDENILTDFPFAPEGSPRRLAGRDALYEYIKKSPRDRHTLDADAEGLRHRRSQHLDRRMEHVWGGCT